MARVVASESTPDEKSAFELAATVAVPLGEEVDEDSEDEPFREELFVPLVAS
jgi:hypothetical protein